MEKRNEIFFATFYQKCTFSYDNKFNTQKDGVAKGSPLGPVMTKIFVVDLKKNVIAKLSIHMTNWKKHVDDKITYIHYPY